MLLKIYKVFISDFSGVGYEKSSDKIAKLDHTLNKTHDFNRFYL